MKAENKDTASLPENNKETQPVDQARRSFSKLGVTLAPVMMTLANRSAWGRDVDICTQSGFVSHNVLQSQAINPVSNPRTFSSPPPNADPDAYNALTDKLGAWQTWGSENGLTGEPFSSLTVTEWEEFAGLCYASSTTSQTNSTGAANNNLGQALAAMFGR